MNILPVVYLLIDLSILYAAPPGPHTSTDMYSALMSQCPIMDNNPSFKGQEVFKKCTDWEAIKQTKQLSPETVKNVLCMLYFDSFILFCKELLQNKVTEITETDLVPVSTDSTVAEICKNGGLFPPNKTLEHDLSKIINKATICYKLCSDFSGNPVKECSLAHYFVNFNVTRLMSKPQLKPSGPQEIVPPAQETQHVPSHEATNLVRPHADALPAVPLPAGEGSVQQVPLSEQPNQPAAADAQKGNTGEASAAKDNLEEVKQSQKAGAEGHEPVAVVTKEKPAVAQGQAIARVQAVPQEHAIAQEQAVLHEQAVSEKQEVLEKIANTKLETKSESGEKTSKKTADVQDTSKVQQNAPIPKQHPDELVETVQAKPVVAGNESPAKPQRDNEKAPAKDKSPVDSPAQEPNLEDLPKEEVDEKKETENTAPKNVPYEAQDQNEAEQNEEEDDDEDDMENPVKDIVTIEEKKEKKEKPSTLAEELPVYNSAEELDGESYFFSYFMVICVLFVLGYVGYHNRQKVMALVVEGKRGKRQYRNRRPNSANYHKLDSNLEEAISSSCTKNTSHVIY